MEGDVDLLPLRLGQVDVLQDIVEHFRLKWFVIYYQTKLETSPIVIEEYRFVSGKSSVAVADI